jgi:valyl-tRNA synthetase
MPAYTVEHNVLPSDLGHVSVLFVLLAPDEGEAGGNPGTPSEDMGRWVVGRTRADAEAAAAAAYPGRTVTLTQDEDVLDTW